MKQSLDLRKEKETKRNEKKQREREVRQTGDNKNVIENLVFVWIISAAEKYIMIYDTKVFSQVKI